MARGLDNLRQITTFLMMNNSNPTKGYSAAEIAEAVPSLKERSVYRILKDNPQFVQTSNSVFPTRYYFDPLKVPQVRAKPDSWQIRPEFKVEPISAFKFLKNLIASTKADENYVSKIYEQVRPVGKAANNAIAFQRNSEALQPALWDAAKFSLDQLEVFSATLYQRIRQIKDDPRYDTPEWWAIFEPED